MTDTPVFIGTGADAPREDQSFVERNAISAIVRNPNDDTYLVLKWKDVDWETFVTGGVEDGHTPEEAARAEVHEETGYKHLTFVKELPKYHAKFYHAPKGVNRFAHFSNFLFELENNERDTIDEDEQRKHDCVWLTRAELNDVSLPEGHRWLLEYIDA